MKWKEVMMLGLKLRLLTLKTFFIFVFDTDFLHDILSGSRKNLTPTVNQPAW